MIERITAIAAIVCLVSALGTAGLSVFFLVEQNPWFALVSVAQSWLFLTLTKALVP